MDVTITLEFESDGDLKVFAVTDIDSETNLFEWYWDNPEEAIFVDDGEEVFKWDIEKLTKEDLWFINTSDSSSYKCEAIYYFL